MKDILYNLDSVEEFYASTLTSVIQIKERINSINEYVESHNHILNDFEKQELAARIEKIASLNSLIQKELIEESYLLVYTQFK